MLYHVHSYEWFNWPETQKCWSEEWTKHFIDWFPIEQQGEMGVSVQKGGMGVSVQQGGMGVSVQQGGMGVGVQQGGLGIGV